VPGTHLTKTEFLAVVSKIAKLPQIFILDSKGFFAIFGTVTSSFSIGNRLLANFPYTEIQMTPGDLLAQHLFVHLFPENCFVSPDSCKKKNKT